MNMNGFKRAAVAIATTVALSAGLALATTTQAEATRDADIPRMVHKHLHKERWVSVKVKGKNYILKDSQGGVLVVEPAWMAKLCGKDKACKAFATLDVEMAKALKRELAKCKAGSKGQKCRTQANRRVKSNY